MNAVQGLGALALVLLSGGTGWMLYAPEAPPPAPASAEALPADDAAQRLSVLSWPRPAEEPADAAPQAAQAGCDLVGTRTAPAHEPLDATEPPCRHSAGLAPQRDP